MRYAQGKSSSGSATRTLSIAVNPAAMSSVDSATNNLHDGLTTIYMAGHLSFRPEKGGMGAAGRAKELGLWRPPNLEGKRG